MTSTLSPRAGPRRRNGAARGLVALGVVALAGALVGWVASGMDVDRGVALAGLGAAVAVLAAAIIARPEIAALATLAIVAVVPVDTLFRYDLPFLSGGLKVTDLLFFACLASWLAGHILDPYPVRLPSLAVTVLALGFVGLGFVGVVTARANGVELKFALLELRAIVGLLLMFPIVDGVRRLRDVEIGLAVFLLATGVSAFVIARDFFVGNSSPALFSDEATRVNNLVYLYPLAGLIWVFALLPWVRGRARWWLFALAGLTSAALYFTSRRGGWIVALVAPLAVLALIPRSRRRGFGRVLVAVVVASVLSIGVINARSDNPISSPLTTARERLFSSGEGEGDISTGHRLAEFRQARALIADDPLTGIGLGATITFISPLYSPTYNLADVPSTNVYVHDSYLWVALKLGLIAFAVFLGLLAAVVRDAYVGYRRAVDPRVQRLMLGGLVTLVALIGISLTEPHLTYVGSAPLFVAAIALTQVVPQLPSEEGDEEPA